MGAKGSVEAAKLNADGWGHMEVCQVKIAVSFKLIKLKHVTS